MSVHYSVRTRISSLFFLPSKNVKFNCACAAWETTDASRQFKWQSLARFVCRSVARSPCCNTRAKLLTHSVWSFGIHSCHICDTARNYYTKHKCWWNICLRFTTHKYTTAVQPTHQTIRRAYWEVSITLFGYVPRGVVIFGVQKRQV